MRAVCVIAAALIASLATASDVDVRVAQDGAYVMRVTSLREARFATTMRQKYDFSCGSAALATLLTYHYGQPVSEQEVFAKMYAAGDRAKIGKQGFSLLDMKHYLTARGFQADQAVLRELEQGLPDQGA